VRNGHLTVSVIVLHCWITTTADLEVTLGYIFPIVMYIFIFIFLCCIPFYYCVGKLNYDATWKMEQVHALHMETEHASKSFSLLRSLTPPIDQSAACN